MVGSQVPPQDLRPSLPSAPHRGPQFNGASQDDARMKLQQLKQDEHLDAASETPEDGPSTEL